MKKILISIDDESINWMNECIKKLNSAPEEGGGWNKSRFIRVAIFKEWTRLIKHRKDYL